MESKKPKEMEDQMNEFSKQDLLEKAVNDFIKNEDLKAENIIVRIQKTNDGRPIGPTEIFCIICLNLISSAIWDGVKWVWTHYDHSCSAPPPPPQELNPRTCYLCHEKLIPGKIHYCK